jgi:hypothetical protein
MMIPFCLCGDAKTAALSSRRHIARFKKGASWIEAGAMVDVQRAPGLIMVGDPSSLLSGVKVRLYAPFWELQKAVASARITLETSVRAFDQALEHVWSLLGLLSPACFRWLLDSERGGRFLEAVIARWDEIDAVGSRYTYGLSTPRALDMSDARRATGSSTTEMEARRFPPLQNCRPGRSSTPESRSEVVGRPFAV